MWAIAGETKLTISKQKSKKLRAQLRPKLPTPSNDILARWQACHRPVTRERASCKRNCSHVSPEIGTAPTCSGDSFACRKYVKREAPPRFLREAPPRKTQLSQQFFKINGTSSALRSDVASRVLRPAFLHPGRMLFASTGIGIFQIMNFNIQILSFKSRQCIVSDLDFL
jgi:hypothetical protein